MKHYLVFVDSAFTRNTQVFDPFGFADDTFDNIDRSGSDYEAHWVWQKHNLLLGIYSAVSEEAACRKAGKRHNCDPRILVAIDIEKYLTNKAEAFAEKTIIRVEGGMVQEVYSSVPNMDIIIEDNDLLNENPCEPENVTNLTKLY